MFAELARDSALRRAGALRRSMVALTDDPGRRDIAHLTAWVSFVLVGEGGAPPPETAGLNG